MNQPAVAERARDATGKIAVDTLDPNPSDCIFDFGGTAIAFQCATREWLARLAERLAGFAAVAEPDLTFRYEVTDAAPAVAEAFPAALCEQPSFEREQERFRLDGPSFTAEVDLRAQSVSAQGPLATYPVDLVLRQLLPVLAAPRVLLHSAVVSDGDRAWACVGPSGAGKSTIAALLSEHAVCDELSCVELTTGGAEVRSLPYWKARPGHAQLAGVYLLHHSSGFVRTRVDRETALHTLTRQILWPLLSPSAMRSSFETLADLVERVPVWRLGFLPHASVWEHIARES